MTRLTKLDNHVEDGLVLLIILPQRQKLDETGQHLGDRHLIGVLGDEPAHTACRVVEQTCLVLRVKERLDLAENGGQLAEDLAVARGLLAEQTDTIDRVGLGLRVLVRETVHKQLQEVARVRCAGFAHVANALGDSADCCASLDRLLAAGILDNGLLERLPQLAKSRSKGDGEAGDDLHGRLDEQPVVLRRLVEHLALVVITQILLARVALGDDGQKLLHNLRNNGTLLGHEHGRAAELECRANIAVDIGDGATTNRSAGVSIAN